MKQLTLTKSAIKYFGLLILILSGSTLYSQCSVQATVSNDTICGGNSISLSSTGGCGTIMEDNFNSGVIGSLWLSNPANPVFTNPCGPGPNGIHAWIGTTPSLLRSMETVNYNVSTGNCFIEWYMRYGRVQGAGSCEDPDAANEGVHLQYSTNNGSTWTDFPGPNLNPVGPNSTYGPFITITNGSGGYWIPAASLSAQSNNSAYFWHKYSCTIPSVATTVNTKFRFAQLATSSTGYDAWGIDEVKISCPIGYSNVIWSTGDTVFNSGAIYLPHHPNNLPYDTCFVVTVSDSTYSATDTVCVHVYPKPIISYSGISSSYCINSQAVSLIANPSGGIFTGSGISGNTFNPSVAGIGTHQIIYNYTNAYGCSTSDTQIVVVYQLPTVSFSGLAQNYCLNSNANTLIGAPAGGTFSGTGIAGNTFTPSIAGAGSYNITYSYTDANSCSNSISQITNVHSLPFANAGLDKSIPCGSVGAMIGSGTTAGFSYSWSPIAGLSNPNISNPIATPNITTKYTLNITNNTTACSSTDNVYVIITGGPNATVSNDTSVCSGSMVNLSASGGPIYLWSTGDPNPNIIVYPTISTNYSATVTDTNGCADADSVMVTIFPISIVNLGNDTSIKMSNTITLNAGTNFSSYMWNTGSTTQTHVVDGTTLGVGFHTFYVDIVDTNGCLANDTIIIEITDDTGINDKKDNSSVSIIPNPTKGIFKIVINGIQGDIDMQIIDASGRLVSTQKLIGVKDGFVKEIDSANLAKGIYYIKLTNNNTIRVEKLIIQ